MRSLSSAISRMTVSIVPSTGRFTARYAVSLAPRKARLRSEELTPSCWPSTSTKPRTICEKMTPEFPRAPMSAARVTSFATASLSAAVDASSASTIERSVSDEVRAGVAVGDGVHVQVVDPAAVRLEVLERAAREMADDLELHQCRTPSMCTSSDAIGSPTMRSSSYWTRERTVCRDLGELHPVLDDHAELDDEPVRRAGRRRRPS